MKNFKQEKRTKSAIPVLLVILFVSIFTLGLTFAWYYSSNTTDDSTVTMAMFELNLRDEDNNMNDQAVITTNIPTNLVPNQLLELDPLTLLITSNSPVSIRLKILPVDENGIILADSIAFTSNNWYKVGDYYYYVSGSGADWDGYYPASDIATTMTVTDITFRINEEVEKDKSGMTASFSIQVEMCQASWAHTGSVDTDLPVGTSKSDAATSASTLEAWNEGETIYYQVMDISNMSATDIADEVNLLNNQGIMPYLNYDTFEKAGDDEEMWWPAFDNSLNENSVLVFYSIEEEEEVTLWQTYAFTDGNLGTNITTLEIPSTIEGYPVTIIGEYAFAELSSVTSVYIPSSIQTICKGAFAYCTQLESVYIPSSIQTIYKYAFAYCTQLEEVHMSESQYQSIDPYSVFVGCTPTIYADGLAMSAMVGFTTSTYLNEHNEWIQDVTSVNLNGNTVVTFPEGTTKISATSLQNNTDITEIYIPASCTTFTNYPFNGCSNAIVYTTWNMNLYENTTSVAGTVEYSISGDSATITDYRFNKDIDWTIPSQICGFAVTGIDDSQQYYTSVDGNYKTFLTGVTVPNTVTSISGCSFDPIDSSAWCRGRLRHITFAPNSTITTFDFALTNNQPLLRQVIIPESVTSVIGTPDEGVIEIINLSPVNLTLSSYPDNENLKQILTTVPVTSNFTTSGDFVFYTYGGTKTLVTIKELTNTTITLPNSSALDNRGNALGSYEVKIDYGYLHGAFINGDLYLPSNITKIKELYVDSQKIYVDKTKAQYDAMGNTGVNIYKIYVKNGSNDYVLYTTL